jgi:RNA polymerase sigma-70 factor (ECF subfamily)
MITLPPKQNLTPFSGLFTSMKQRTNSEWVSGLTAGSPTEATALADLRALMLRAVNLFLSRKGLIESAANAHDLAEDCAQEAVLLIRDKLPQFRGESQFTTWAYSIGIRVALGELRRRRWRIAAVDKAQLGVALPGWPIDGPGPERSLEQRQAWALLSELIESSLTPLQRKALIAHAFQGMPLDEVAEWLGSNRNSVYKLIHDARKRLKSALLSRGVSHAELLSTFEAAGPEPYFDIEGKSFLAQDIS